MVKVNKPGKDVVSAVVNTIKTGGKNLSPEDAKAIKNSIVTFLAMVFVYCIGHSRGSLSSGVGSYGGVGGGAIRVGSQYDTRPHYLEELMFHYGSDKSKDDHKYTDLYQMLFGPIRANVENVVEIGLGAGQSIQAWYHFFPNAKITGFDTSTVPSLEKIVDKYSDRFTFINRNLQKPEFQDPKKVEEEFGLYPGTVDIIIEDANHRPRLQQELLTNLWPFVKPGGYYVIESIAMSPSKEGEAAPGDQWRDMQNHLIKPILMENDAVLVDTHIGHRAWPQWLKKNADSIAKDHIHHDSYALVIHKRVVPLPKEIKMNHRSVAGKSEKVVYTELP